MDILKPVIDPNDSVVKWKAFLDIVKRHFRYIAECQGEGEVKMKARKYEKCNINWV